MFKAVQTNRTINTQVIISPVTLHNMDGQAFRTDALEFNEYPDGEVQVRAMGKRLNKDGTIRKSRHSDIGQLERFWLDDVEEQMALVWYKGQS